MGCAIGADVVWREWLPPEAGANVGDDAARFGCCVRALRAEWGACRHDPATAPGETIKWIPIYNALFDTRADFALADLRAAAEVLLDIVVAADADVPARSRWAASLSTLLRVKRRQLTAAGLVVPWRPLYDMLKRLASPVSLATYTGIALTVQQAAELLNVAHRSRRFFPPGASAEVWAEFAPLLSDPGDPAACEALGWLAAFLPTHALGKPQRGREGGDEGGGGEVDGSWSVWVPALVEAWRLAAHSNYWHALCLRLLARCAKHDVGGVVDWAALQPALATQVLWTFQVPVGSATSRPPIAAHVPALCSSLFQSQASRSHGHAAKLYAYLLSRPAPAPEPPRAPADGTPAGGGAGNPSQAAVAAGGGAAPEGAPRCGEADGDAAVRDLLRTIMLLEQFYHPSNGGRWTRPLEEWMSDLCKHVCKRCKAEAQGRCQAPPGAPRPRGTLTADEARCIADAIVRIASKAQFSKDRQLMNRGCAALATMAELAPAAVLPLVAERFSSALTAITAPHQLASSIRCLALCARTLMRFGIEADGDAAGAGGGDSPQALAAGALADALTATLPGIDANDPSKTLSTFMLYTSVLSSAGRLQGGSEAEAGEYGGGAMPLYLDEWAGELLQRSYVLLSNLAGEAGGGGEGGEGEGRDGGSFLLSESSTFKPMMQLLFGMLPPDVRSRCVRSLGRFVATSTIPGMVNEAGAMVLAATMADPAAAVEHVLAPLLERLREDVPALQTAAANGDAAKLSQAHIEALCWQLGVCEAVAHCAGPALLPHAPALRSVLDAVLRAPVARVQEAGGRLLSQMLTGLATFYPTDVFAPPKDMHVIGGVAVADWWGKYGDGCSQPPSWHVPSEKEVALANALVQQFGLGAAAELSAGVAPGAALGTMRRAAAAAHVHGLLSAIGGVVQGAKAGLADAEEGGAPGGGASLAPAGRLSVPLGPPGARAELAAALAAAAGGISGDDSDNLEVLANVAGMLLCNGSIEYDDWRDDRAAWQADEWLLHEQAVASIALPTAPDPAAAPAATGDKPRVFARRPRWLWVERARLYLTWRASQAAYRWWAAEGGADVPLGALPGGYRALVGALQAQSFHRYAAVRDAASQALEGAAKRYPALAPPLAAAGMRVLAGLPLPPPDASGVVCADGVTAGEWAALRDVVPRPGDAAEGGPGGDSDPHEGRGLGALALLQAKPVWRHVSRCLLPYASMFAALMGSAVHGGQEFQEALAKSMAYTVVRHLRPPPLMAVQLSPGSHEYPAPIAELAAALRGAGGGSGGALPPRYALVADLALLMLLPPPGEAEAAATAGQLLGALRSQLTFRRLAAQQGWTMVDQMEQAGRRAAAGAAVAEAVAADASWGQQLLAVLALSHAGGATASGEEPPRGAAAMRLAMLSGGKEGMLIAAFSTATDTALQWPPGAGAAALEALRDGTFVVGHARLVKVLCKLAPEAMLATLCGPLHSALSTQADAGGGGGGGDKSAMHAAIEVLAGVVASGACFRPAGDGAAAWEVWVRPLLAHALRTAPADARPQWSAGLRFGVAGLLDGAVPALHHVLALVAEPVPPGAPSWAAVQRLQLLSSCMAEALSSRGRLGDANRRALHVFAAGRLQELPAVMDLSGEAVRVRGAKLAATLCGAVMAADAAAEWQASAADAQQPAGSPAFADGTDADADKAPGPSGASSPLEVKCSDDDDDAMVVVPSAGPATTAALAPAAREWLALLRGRFAEGVAAIAKRGEGGGEDSDAATAVGMSDVEVIGQRDIQPLLSEADEVPAVAREGAEGERSLAHVAFAVQFVVAAVRGGLGIALSPHLLRMLPDLMRIQDLAPPELQQLSLEAKAALALLKYVPVQPLLLEGVVQALEQGAAERTFAARAAALTFSQYFWFRNLPQLGPGQLERLVSLAVGRLADQKLEVRELAAATLSGMMKGLPGPLAHRLRADFLSGVARMFPQRRAGRRAAAAAGQAGVAERHAPLLGLKAAVLSAPYDVPPWLPEVLAAVARVAAEPQPFRATASSALAEFRRTHEESALAAVREALGEEQWEAVTDVGTPAQYFV